MSMHKTFRHFLSSELDVPKNRKKELSEAKNDIREHLRKYLPVALNQEFNDYTPEFTRPRFRTQGSWTHGTLNMPAHKSQHIDIDDGVYIKIDYFKDKAEPITCSKRVFKAVQNALRSLCLQRGWTLICEIAACVRVDLNNGAHVDIPIYATSENTFQFLEAKKAECTSRGFLQDQQQINDVLTWGMLDGGDVLLAHRESGWIVSDPGPVTMWLRERAAFHGPQFIPSIRYIKSWRDWQWEQGGPSSICLMVAVERVFSPEGNYDELALLNTLSKLPDMLAQKVPNPANPDEDLAEKLDKNGTRQEVINKLKAFHSSMQQAIESPEQSEAIFKNCFGSRFPDSPQQSSVDIATAVIATPAHKVQSPIVKRSRSGQQVIKRTRSG